MTRSLPPELATREDRETRAAELRREIRREWLYFGFADIPLGLAVFGCMGLYFAGEISYTAVTVIVAGYALISGLVVFWIKGRVRPLQTELERLEHLDGHRGQGR